MTERVDVADLEGRPAAEALPGDPRVVRLQLAAGEFVPPHAHPGATVLVVVLEGVLAATVDGERHELAAGELLRFDGDREIAPAAVADAVALVVLVGEP